MLLLPPQSRPPPKNPLPARFLQGAFVISVCFCPISYILYLVSYISLTSTFGFTTYHILREWFLAAYFLPEKMSNGVGSLCITEEMRGQARFVLTFCEIWIRMTVSKLPI